SSIQSPTHLTIPDKGEIYLVNDFELSFDIYFWQKDPFGYIISAGNDKVRDYFILSYSDYRHPDTSYIELTVKNKSSIISIPIPDNLQGKNIWRKLSIKFEYSQNRIGLSFDNGGENWCYMDEPLFHHLQFIFGGTFRRIEPPRMAIRNIQINENNNHLITWPLNEIDGPIANGRSIKGEEYKGRVTNGNWLSGHHSQWQKIFSHDITGKDFQFIKFNPNSMQSIFIKNDSLYFSDLTNSKENNAFPFTKLPQKYNYLYDGKNHQLLSWYEGGNSPIASFDFTTNTWKGYELNLESKKQYFGHSIIRDEVNSDWYILGGYGWYTVKNDLQLYDSKSNDWKQVPYSTTNNDLFYPRNEMVIHHEKTKGSYLIYGGSGNESGTQEQGFRNLNDLWSLNLQTRTFTKLWDDESLLPFTNFSSKTVIVPEMNRIFHMVMQNSLIDSIENVLYQSFIDNKDFQNTHIRFQPKGVSDFDIFDMEFNLKTNELILVVKTKRQKNNESIDSIEYYSLNLPLTHIVIIPKTANNYWKYILLVVGLGSVIWYFSKNSNLPEKNDTIDPHSLIIANNSMNENEEKILEKGVTVKVFGTFKMWVDGREIHHKDWRSKKARELFIFILLKNNNGVSIKDINLTFWPDVNKESATNSRAVALNKIRKIIFPYTDLIMKVDDRLCIRETNILYSDYLDLYHHLQNGNRKMIKDQRWPILLHGKSGVLPDIQDDWVDLIRIDMLKSVVRYCKTTGEKYNENKDWENLVWIGKRILELDQFDDDGLFFAVKGSKSQMKDGIAHKIYADY
ncbi:hypothetical protein OAP60_02005, partial [bacterium]|nr:hypothetical protein [bacterium]